MNRSSQIPEHFPTWAFNSRQQPTFLRCDKGGLMRDYSPGTKCRPIVVLRHKTRRGFATLTVTNGKPLWFCKITCLKRRVCKIQSAAHPDAAHPRSTPMSKSETSVSLQEKLYEKPHSRPVTRP